MPKAKKLSLPEFQRQYGSETQCRNFLYEMRWSKGFICPKCGASGHCRLTNGRIQCDKCHHQTTVTAGTIMHRSHVPLTKWFLAIYFVSQDKRGISAVQLQAMIGVTYKTAWYVLVRIRKAMGQRDETHHLSGIVEFD
ncbi:MAG: IS1595 family transposase, partial [Ruthenibacterium sp.]